MSTGYSLDLPSLSGNLTLAVDKYGQEIVYLGPFKSQYVGKLNACQSTTSVFFSRVNLILFLMELSLHSFSVIFLSHGVIIRGSVTGGEESSPAETGWHALSDG